MPSLTLSQLQVRVLGRLDNNTALYTPDELTYAINEAIFCLNTATGFLNIAVALPFVTDPNRVWYDVPSPIFIPLRVQYEDKYLEPLSPQQIGSTVPNWTALNTALTGLHVQNWIPAGLTKFGIYPADAVGGNQLSVTGIQSPTPLVDPSDTVQFPNEILIAFDLLAAHSLQLKESEEEFAASSDYYKAYLTQIKKLTLWRSFISPRYYNSRAQQDSREEPTP